MVGALHLMVTAVSGLPWLALAPVEDAGRGYAGPRDVEAPSGEMPTRATDERPRGDVVVREDEGTEPSPPRPGQEDTASRTDTREAERTWIVSGLVDVAYLVNTNFPDNHVYRPMAPSPRTGELALNVVAAFLDHEPTDEEPWIVHLAAHAGAGVDALYEAEPVPGGDDGKFAGAEVFKHIALANAGLKAPWGTQVVGGLMPAPIGIEWFWSDRNWNYSASWNALGTPYYLMGLSIDQELPRDVHLFGWLVNGWQTIADLNRVPSYLVGVSWAPIEGLSAATMVYFGPEDVDISPEAWRVHSDSFVQYEVDRWGLAVMWDYGREKVTALPDDPVALWTGGGLFVRGRPLQRERLTVDVAARPEAWWDRDGRIFGVPQWLISGSVGVHVELFDIILARVEYRYDRSTADDGFFFRDDAITDDADGLADEQHTVFLNLSGHFEHAFATRPPSHE